MVSHTNIPEVMLREHINRAVTDVFDTMLTFTPTLSVQADRQAGELLPPVEVNQPLIVGTVGFVGEVNGLIYLHFGVPFARICTAHLLGLTEAELDDETINDAIGELTNMTVGSFKNGLCDAGFPCMLTIPSVVRGRNFSIARVSSAVRHIFQFDCSEHRVVADILIKSEK